MPSYWNYFGVVMSEAPRPTSYFRAQTPGATLTGSNGADQLADMAGGNRLSGGADGDSYVVIDSRTRVVESAGGGVDTITAYSDFVAPTGVEVLKILGNQKTGVANDSGMLLTVNGLRSVLVGGAGNDVLVDEGGGQTRFSVARSGGYDVIHNFTATGANHDWIQLVGYGLTRFDQVSALMTQVGSDVKITLSANDAVLIRNVQMSNLSAQDFLLELSTDWRTPAYQDNFNTVNLRTGSGTTGWSTTFTSGSTDVWNGYSSRTLTSNHELQLYVDPLLTGSGKTPLGLNPFSADAGILQIHARPTTAAEQNVLWGYDYASGLLTTAGSFTQTYGYFEIRAQLPEQQGVWPAFWLLPANRNGTAEIDVFEQVGDDSVHQTVHSSAAGSPARTGFSSLMPQASTGFHTYGVLWTAQTITWYIDGIATASVPTPADMHSPMYMLVNLAIGGDWPGNPSPGFSGADLLVDYVRAYSLDEMNRPLHVTSAVSTALADGYVRLTLTGSADVNGTGNSLDNTLIGNAGANTLDGGAGADAMSGGAGDDRYVVDHVGDTAVEGVNEGWDRVFSTVSYTIGADIEGLSLSGAASINGTGNGLGNSMAGNGGANVLNGGAGADTINGYSGNDTLIGGQGADQFAFARWTGADVINDFGLNGEKDVIDVSAFKSAGIAVSLTQQGSDVLVAMATGETILVRGTSLANFEATAVGYTFRPIVLDISASVSTILGDGHLRLTLSGAANVNGTGNSLDNTLIGNAGANTLDGGAGADTMSGGAGDDRYVVDNVGDVVVERVNEGWDRVTSTVSYTIGANIEGLSLAGAASINATGNSLGNSMAGSTGANVMDGGAGADTINGYSGNDTLIGGEGADQFVFTRWTGADTINDFGLDGERDVIDVSAFTSAGIASSLRQQGSDALISLATGETILVKNVQLADLQIDPAGYAYEPTALRNLSASQGVFSQVLADDAAVDAELSDNYLTDLHHFVAPAAFAGVDPGWLF
ncbi:hypothetical protein BZG35_05710 [Brevundimonas sp. LM2]|uniref:family 16 glycosylhydrolase n=1 Tax=Brevundimonas sp. LM2 TaxID=1938605 RepID=UPI000983D0CC|nr:family 16 glycosylhydrolase [Brevundimonas sp. LM2]AQR61204.1 hypothetical protein BZG35_05710 [Brevundimonas sp. LM2]